MNMKIKMLCYFLKNLNTTDVKLQYVPTRMYCIVCLSSLSPL